MPLSGVSATRRQQTPFPIAAVQPPLAQIPHHPLQHYVCIHPARCGTKPTSAHQLVSHQRNCGVHSKIRVVPSTFCAFFSTLKPRIAVSSSAAASSSSVRATNDQPSLVTCQQYLAQ
jgi:hypothetical protein